jgi:hypothetical protein
MTGEYLFSCDVNRTGKADRILSSWLESAYASEATWPHFSRHGHFVVMDLSGFGCSERRDALMSPRATGFRPSRR